MFASGKTNAVANGTANYIEDVFSTYLYTGNGSTQTITNGIDLAGKGGLVWCKSRSIVASNALVDTARGATNYIISNNTNAQSTNVNSLTSFNSDGFSIGSLTGFNQNAATFASWTFRKQPKFFDVKTVSHTYGVNNTIDFSTLGTIGCVIIKQTDGAGDWYVWHRSLGNAYYGLWLNSTGAPSNFGTAPVQVSGTTVTMTDSSAVGGYFPTGSYVVYAYAHNAGGFGLTGTDNVISCGSLTMDGSGNPASVTLGYEPQLVLVKRTDAAGAWYIEDNMRGMPVTGNGAQLYPNTSGAEAAQNIAYPNATGFTWNIGIPSATYIYIAIRRGPMKVPTSGTSVFSPQTSTGVQTTNFVVDSYIGVTSRSSPASVDPNTRSRLIGAPYLTTSSTAAEAGTTSVGFDSNTGLTYSWAAGGVNWYFRRASSFFDEVCWSSTGSAQTLNHNLGVVPELMIRKVRNGTWESWMVYAAPIGNTKILYLDQTAAQDTNNGWDNQTPTASQFYVNNTLSGYNFVTYLFATCAGVSKVGSYTGNGSTQTINCGFTGGARFVLIKRTDSTGDWYVWDTARGIVTANDPHLSLNTTAAEVTTDDTIDTDSTGFVVNQVTATNVNVSSATYIYLAIA